MDLEKITATQFVGSLLFGGGVAILPIVFVAKATAIRGIGLLVIYVPTAMLCTSLYIAYWQRANAIAKKLGQDPRERRRRYKEIIGSLKPPHER